MSKNVSKIDVSEVTKQARVASINAAKKFVADTSATTYGQNESAKTIIRLLVKEGYIDMAVFETKAGELAGAQQDEETGLYDDVAIKAAKLQLFALIHPLTNAAAMNRTLKEAGVLTAASDADDIV